MRISVIGLLGVPLLACSPGPRFDSVQTVASHRAENPTIAADPRSGVVFVAWVGMETDSSWNVYLARMDSAGAFRAPVRVNDRSGDVSVATQNPAQVVVGSDGTVYVGWVSNRAPAHSPVTDVGVRLARSTDGGATFSASSTLRVDPGSRSLANMYYDLAPAPDGSLYASWLDLHYYTDSLAAHEAHHIPESVPVPETRVDFRVARSTDGGRSFAGKTILDSSSCICCRTAITVGSDDALHALWRHVFPGDVRDFLSTRSTDGAATFATPVRVHDDHWVLNGCPDIGPDIAIDGRGTVHAAWYTGAPGRQGLWHAISSDNGAHFEEPTALLTDRYVPPSEVKLATLGEAVWAVWEDKRITPGRIRFALVPGGSATTLGAGEFPTIASGAGVIAVAWSDRGAVKLRIARAHRLRN